MKKIDIINKHKTDYAMLEAKIAKMPAGLERAVAQHVTLTWIKGTKWMGGLSDAAAERAYSRVTAMGYSWEQVDAEFERQIYVEFADLG